MSKTARPEVKYGHAEAFSRRWRPRYFRPGTGVVGAIKREYRRLARHKAKEETRNAARME